MPPPLVPLDGSSLSIGLALFPLFLFHQNRQADVVGILGDDAFELPVVGVVQRIVAQVQGHAGAALGALNAFDLKVARPTTDPAHAVCRRQTRTARFDGDFVRHDEARVKTHAKLADQLRIRLLVARQLGDKVFGAAFGDGAQVVDGFLLGKANAVVGNRQRFGFFVEADAHFQIRRVFQQDRVVQRFITQLVAGVRGVGDQLAHENLFVGVQRVGDEVQQLGYFGLEGQGLLGHES